jgi:O-antigen chain-terminating methyltransferase
MSENSFYRAFEDRHRGSRELIKSRLEVYRPFIEPLIDSEETSYGIDLGCGRGEWLEILREMGISALGVDLDQGMLSACSERGLQAIQGDAIAYLSTLEDESQLLVSAFHVVEHISFEQLQKLVEEAYRVLKPGGLLIMETPNPENIMVATCSFYLDPTHTRPIPPDLLMFMTEFSGFSRSKIVRLQEGIGITSSRSLNLNDVLGGASPDYAVIAQKMGPEKIQSAVNKVFRVEYGVNSIALAEKYTDQLDQKIQQAEAKAQQAEAKAQQAEAKAQQAELFINNIHQSYLWKIIGPLRWVDSQHQKLKEQGSKTRLKMCFRKVLLSFPGASSILRNPDNSIRKFVANLSRHLGFHSLLRKIFIVIGGYPNESLLTEKASSEDLIHSFDDLSKGAQKIYLKMKVDIKSSQYSKADNAHSR